MHVSTASLLGNVHKKFSRAILTLFDISATELYPGLAHEGQFKVSNEDLAFNASVTLNADNLPEYTFTGGLALSFNDSLMALVASPGFFSEIPLDYKSVNRHIVHPSHNFADYSYIKDQPLSQKGQSLLLPLMTSSAERLNLGDALFALTGQVLLLHQTAHFLNGHYFYEQNLYARDQFKEFSGAATRSLEELADRRAMELDADAYAATVILHRYLQSDFESTLSNIATPFGRNHEGWLRLLSAAFMLFFALFAKAEGSNELPDSGRAHPGPEGRFLHFLSILKMVYKQRWKQPLENEDPLVQGMLKDARVILNVLALESSETLDAEINPDRPYIKTLHQCINHRRQITPQLARFSRKACAMMGTVSIHSGSLG